MLSTRTPQRRSLALAGSIALFILAACSPTDPVDAQNTDIASGEAQLAAAEAQGLVRVTFPNPDPGIPVYARLGSPLNQMFHNGRWLVVPFYRNPDQVPAAFNLLQLFDFPGPNGPGAFGAQLLISGQYMIERGAALGTFPKVSVSSGTAVPVWFVDWPTFRTAMADNVVTMAELRAMNPLRGVATRFSETLRPREGDHLLVLNAGGTLTDGRRFDVQVTHVEATTRALRIDIR